MSSIAAISSASSSSASIPTEADTNSASTTWKNASFTQKSRKAFFSLAKTVSARTIGLFALRAPEISPHLAHSAPSSPRPSTSLKRGSIPHFSTPRPQMPLPRIVVTPADDDPETSEAEPYADSSQEFLDLFWPYNETESFEPKLPKKLRRDRPFFGFKRASIAGSPSPSEHSFASEASDRASEVSESTPRLFYNPKARGDKKKESKPSSSRSMNVMGMVGSCSFDSMPTAQINFMLGKIRRARKSRDSTVYTDDYADSEMEPSEHDHAPFATQSPVAEPLMTTQYGPTINAVSRMISSSSG